MLDCSTKFALPCSVTSDTTDNARLNAVLKLFSPFVLKKCKDFCLLNLIKHIKYNLYLLFVSFDWNERGWMVIHQGVFTSDHQIFFCSLLKKLLAYFFVFDSTYRLEMILDVPINWLYTIVMFSRKSGPMFFTKMEIPEVGGLS